MKKASFMCTGEDKAPPRGTGALSARKTQHDCQALFNDANHPPVVDESVSMCAVKRGGRDLHLRGQHLAAPSPPGLLAIADEVIE